MGAAGWGLAVALAVYVVAAVSGVAIAVASTGEVAYWTHGVRYAGAAIGWMVGTEASVVDYAGPVRLGFGGSGPAVPAVFVAALMLIGRHRRERPGVRMAVLGIITALTFATATAAVAQTTARVATTDALTVRVSPGSVFTGGLVVAMLALVAAGVLAYLARFPGAGWVRGSSDGAQAGLLLLGVGAVVALGLVLSGASDGRERALVAASAPVTLGSLSAGMAVLSVGASVQATVSPGAGGATQSDVTLRLTDWPDGLPDAPWMLLALAPVVALALLALRSWSSLRTAPPSSTASLAGRGVAFVVGFAAVVAGATLLGSITAYGYGEGFVRPSAGLDVRTDAGGATAWAVLFATVAVVITHAVYANRSSLPSRRGDSPSPPRGRVRWDLLLGSLAPRPKPSAVDPRPDDVSHPIESQGRG